METDTHYILEVYGVWYTGAGGGFRRAAVLFQTFLADNDDNN